MTWIIRSEVVQMKNIWNSIPNKSIVEQRNREKKSITIKGSTIKL